MGKPTTKTDRQHEGSLRFSIRKCTISRQDWSQDMSGLQRCFCPASRHFHERREFHELQYKLVKTKHGDTTSICVKNGIPQMTVLRVNVMINPNIKPTETKKNKSFPRPKNNRTQPTGLFPDGLGWLASALVRHPREIQKIKNGWFQVGINKNNMKMLNYSKRFCDDPRGIMSGHEASPLGTVWNSPYFFMFAGFGRSTIQQSLWVMRPNITDLLDVLSGMIWHDFKDQRTDMDGNGSAWKYGSAWNMGFPNNLYDFWQFQSVWGKERWSHGIWVPNILRQTPMRTKNTVTWSCKRADDIGVLMT